MVEFKKGDKVIWCPVKGAPIGKVGVIKKMKNDAVALVDFDGREPIPMFTTELRKAS